MRPIVERQVQKILEESKLVKSLLENNNNKNVIFDAIFSVYMINGYNIKTGTVISRKRLSDYLITEGEITKGQAIQNFYEINERITKGELGPTDNFNIQIMDTVKSIVNECYEKIGLEKRV